MKEDPQIIQGTPPVPKGRKVSPLLHPAPLKTETAEPVRPDAQEKGLFRVIAEIIPITVTTRTAAQMVTTGTLTRTIIIKAIMATTGTAALMVTMVTLARIATIRAIMATTGTAALMGTTGTPVIQVIKVTIPIPHPLRTVTRRPLLQTELM
jgi:hypothetical protein